MGIRYLGHDVVAGGNDVEDATWFGLRFAEGRADYLSVSKGGRFEDARQPKVGEAVYPYTGESGTSACPRWSRTREARSAATCRWRRRQGRPPGGGHGMPVVTSGGVSTFDQAEGILARGEADIVAAARQTLADPDWFLKIRLGYGHLVRRCEFTNYCEGLDQRHKQVTCKLWDRDLDPDDPSVRLASDGRRRLAPPAWRPPAGTDERP